MREENIHKNKMLFSIVTEYPYVSYLFCVECGLTFFTLFFSFCSPSIDSNKLEQGTDDGEQRSKISQSDKFCPFRKLETL